MTTEYWRNHYIDDFLFNVNRSTSSQIWHFLSSISVTNINFILDFLGISGESGYLNLQWNSDGTKCPSTITPTLLYDKCWFCACDTCKETVFFILTDQLDLD